MKLQHLRILPLCLLCLALQVACHAGPKEERPRIIVTSDGEIDDECSLVRFLLYTNEWDVEAIITSSSQYHWHGHGWAAPSSKGFRVLRRFPLGKAWCGNL